MCFLALCPQRKKLFGPPHVDARALWSTFHWTVQLLQNHRPITLLHRILNNSPPFSCQAVTSRPHHLSGMSQSRENTPMSSMDDISRSMYTSQNASSDPATIIEQRIKSLIDTLSNVVTDISKDKQLSNKKMEELAGQFKTLGDIDSALQDQLDVMQECLMSADFNACRPLNDHEAETYEEMELSVQSMMRDIINPQLFLPFEYSGREEVSNSSNEDDSEGGPSILKREFSKLDTSQHQVTFAETTNKRFLEVDVAVPVDSDERGSDEEIPIYKDEEAQKVKEMLRILQNEGWVLNEKEQQWLNREDKDVEGYENEDMWDPSYDDVGRIMERLIRNCKDKFKLADSNYQLAKSITESGQDSEQLDLLFAERKRIKVLLKKALEVRNDICNLTEDEIKERHKKKMQKKLEKAKRKAEKEAHRIRQRAKGRLGFSELVSDPSPAPDADVEMGDGDEAESESQSEEELKDNFIAGGVEYTYGKHVVEVEPEPEPSDVEDADAELDDDDDDDVEAEDVDESILDGDDDEVLEGTDHPEGQQEPEATSPGSDPEPASGASPEEMETE
uniref:Helicase ARIP4 n=1 Tax=Panagrellus redivivus TaxID=6233 RepID=A0A7E4ZR79_PANRE